MASYAGQIEGVELPRRLSSTGLPHLVLISGQLFMCLPQPQPPQIYWNSWCQAISMKLARFKYNKPSSRQFFDHTISHMQWNTIQTETFNLFNKCFKTVIENNGFGKWSNWKYANTRISVFSVWPLPKVENRFRKQIWNENVHISILNFLLKCIGQYLKKSMDFPLYFQKVMLLW